MVLQLTNRGMSLREAKCLWCRIGGTIAPVRRTGEEKYWHPALRRWIKVSVRRKDAPRALVAALRNVERVRAAA